MALAAALLAAGARAEDVPFVGGDDAAIVVPVAVEGVGTLPFLLDTGSTVTWVDDALAEALALRAEGAFQLVTIAGSRRVVRSHVPRLTLGPHILDGVEVMVGRLPALAGAGAPVRGVLGQTALSRVSYGIDYRRRRVVFAPVAGKRVARLPLAWRDGRPAAVTRDDQSRPLALVLDAGLDQPVLFERRARPLPYPDVAGLRYAAETAAGEARLRAVALPALYAGSLRLDRLTAAVADDAAAGGREEDGLLPTRLFASVYFDLAAGEVALEPR